MTSWTELANYSLELTMHLREYRKKGATHLDTLGWYAPSQEEAFGKVMERLYHEKVRLRLGYGSYPVYNVLFNNISLPYESYLYERRCCDYYILSHELIHATGHRKRLNRLPLWKILMTGHKGRAQEEMTAEYGAYILARALGLKPDLLQSIVYIDDWRRCLNETQQMKGINDAIKAVNYLINGKQNEH